MAKVCIVERNKKRERMIKSAKGKRAELKKIIMDKNAAFEDRFEAGIKLSEMPKNSSKVRHKRRCEVTGRGRSVYRKFRMSRIMLRQLGSFGQIPGLVKSSW